MSGIMLPDVFGVDFSGATDAGRRIWIAEAAQEGRFLTVLRLIPARCLPGSGDALRPALTAVRALIATRPKAIFGIDAPFGLPVGLVYEPTWPGFVRAFAPRYRTAEAFKRCCLEQAGGSEWKRKTDVAAQTPFSPYNLRLYKQTFYVLRDVIRPLIGAGQGVVLPMQSRIVGRAAIVEVCPASTLIASQMRDPYKEPRFRAARARLLDWLVQTTPMRLPRDVRQAAIDQPNGDAVDAVIAATAAWRSMSSQPITDAVHRLEGFVYL